MAAGTDVPPSLPLPPPPRPPGGRRPHWSVLLAAILSVAALVASVVAIVRSDDDGDEETRTRRDTTTTTLGPATQEELDQVVDEISRFVEEERGLDFREPVDVELADDEEFEARLFEDYEEDAAELDRFEPIYQALGLVDPDDDLADDLEDALSAGVIGFYDPETTELVVRGTALTPFVRVTIAHELTHALDDQHFGIDRPEYDDTTDEIAYGFTALTEGVASLVEEAYLDQLSDEEQDQYYEELQRLVVGGMPDVSMALLDLIGAPYVDGPVFVEALLDEGQETLDAAYDEPPRTSEQVIDPDAYLEGEGALEVPHPAADGEVAWEGVMGQLAVEVLLADAIDEDDAVEAAEGWGGDWMTSWREAGQACVRLTIVGDTADDTDELADAWSQWGGEHEDDGDLDVSVDQSSPGQPVTVTSCTV